MKNVITFKLWTDNLDNFIEVLRYLIEKDSIFIPEECELGELSEDDYINFSPDIIDTKVKEAVNSKDILFLDFITEKPKNYIHLSLKKGKTNFIKLDIKNQNKTNFLDKLVDIYEQFSVKLNAIFAFAHDFDDAKNTFTNLTVNNIQKIFWINIFGKKLMSYVENIEELKTLKFYSVKNIFEDKDKTITMFRMCESPSDYKTSQFKLLSEAFSVILARNKNIVVTTKEKKDFDTTII